MGIRIPANPIATALAGRLGHPLLSTSVPQDGDWVDPATVALGYEGVATLLIDGGEGEGAPSTVVDITDSRNPVIIREGRGVLR